MIAVAVALVWQRSKPTLALSAPRVTSKPQILKSVVSSYEERTRILRELESIERQVQKGKLPRRRYKVRKRMLESQMTRLDRELVDLKQRVKSVGPKYTEILRELDIAEAELEGVEAEEKRVEARYRSGNLTLDAYRRLQDQLNKRREKAKTTIDGALLRLSEGIA
jgi:chromosome segregation ATPase